MYNGSVRLVGKTPTVKLCKLRKAAGVGANIYAKLEFCNPAGSSKDRVAIAMIKGAKKSGLLKAGGVIVEPTSGNTGIALAAFGVPMGYRVIVTMPSNMSRARRALIGAYGGEAVLTPAGQGMGGAIRRAKKIAEEAGGVVLSQFTNPLNVWAHYFGTGPELYGAGRVDIFVAGIGTGGTVTGVGRYLKSKNRGIRVYGVEPALSPVLTKGYAGAHGIQGIGAGFVPPLLDRDILDGVISVAEGDAFECAALLAKTEGLLAGISSGAALCAALRLASQKQNRGKNIFVLLPDGGERYLC